MRICVADDHPGVRHALRLSLLQLDQIEHVVEVADAMGLLRTLGGRTPDLLLLDWALPGLPPAQLLRLIHSEQPALPIQVLVSDLEQEREALRLGIVNVAHKGAPSGAFVRQVEELLKRHRPIGNR